MAASVVARHQRGEDSGPRRTVGRPPVVIVRPEDDRPAHSAARASIPGILAERRVARARYGHVSEHRPCALSESRAPMDRVSTARRASRRRAIVWG